MHAHTHTHGGSEDREWRLYTIAFLLTISAAMLEIAVKYIVSGSVSLFGDAVHGISDGFTYGFYAIATLIALKFSRQKTFWETTSILVSFSLLFFGCFLVLDEAIERIFLPREIEGWWTLAAAVASLGINAYVLQKLKKGGDDGRSLRKDSISFHAISDALVSLGVIGSSVVIAVTKEFFGTGWYAADWIMALVIGLYLLFLLCTLAVRITRGEPNNHGHHHHDYSHEHD